MFSPRLRPLREKPAFGRPAEISLRRPIQPGQITLFGIVLGAVDIPAAHHIASQQHSSIASNVLQRQGSGFPLEQPIVPGQ